MVCAEASICIVLVFDEPRAVVTSEQDVGIFSEPKLLNSIDNAPCIKVDFFNNVAVESAFTLSLKSWRCVESSVRHCMRNINKERFRFVLLHESYCLVGIALGQRGHV